MQITLDSPQAVWVYTTISNDTPLWDLIKDTQLIGYRKEEKNSTWQNQAHSHSVIRRVLYHCATIADHELLTKKIPLGFCFKIKNVWPHNGVLRVCATPNVLGDK